ncbi:MULTISPECIES: ATP-binding protein [Streptomyces]|uniref:AAA family ATPase n=1 Tax=Streptomyces caniscabiei TaxID=2746961 RepID=A0ABU4N0H3_9ACTN|nr:MULTISPECIES: AAA family ATPase [Streptomyces]MBE4756492.1 AAA family ATPase [Streptomyces caniscabiei]MBE4769003.1 AAA family ATPase [Streptomyces caniscabiei]MBE4782863.1 AAA family ATPase [Streptomyces caniscabiei]MBE4792166.1 AAA family ATPase [Streptomyces caniscabiei]MDX2944950.1 AAA family ATPase [Streptomyces caniscabiei]
MTEARPDAAASASLWERDTEITAITEAIDELCVDKASPGSVLVFTGEAGVGKTALLTEARRIAEQRGCRVWYARGGETVTSVPFNVVRQLLQPGLMGLMEEETREYLGDWYDIAGPALGLAEPGEGQADPQGVCEGLVAAVNRLVRRAWPLVLLIDDLHWADQETLHWLSALADRLTEMCVLVVVARRPGEATGERARHLGRIAAKARPVSTLNALTPKATAGLTRATVGRHADDPFCREVWAVTGGNAYNTVELLAKVKDCGLDPVEDSAGELRALNRSARGTGLVARLEELGVEATRFAWAAAILHTGITVDIVARLASLPRASAVQCAELLTSARILTEPDPANRQADAGDLEFVHPLIATAVYDSIPPGIRTAFHGVAATAVTESGRGAAAASRHLIEVHPDGEAELVEQLRAAAAEHLAVGAPEAARRCLERALKEPPQPDVRVRVLYELGCATLLTSPGTTVEYLRSALAEPGLDSAERVDAVFRLSQVLLHNDQLHEAVRTLDAEIGRLDPGPARMRLQAARYMWEGVHAGEELPPTHSQELAALAATCTGRDNSERALLILRGFDAMTRGENAEEVVELCDRALVNGRLAPGLGWTDTEWGIELLLMLASAYAYADRLDRAESLFTEALRTYESAGWSGGHLALAHAYVGLGHRMRGRLRDAEASLRRSLVLAEGVGRGLPLYWTTTCNLVDTLLVRGHVEEAWAVAEQYNFAPPYPSTIVLPEPRSVRGRLLLAVGRTKEGINELEAAEKATAARGHHNTVSATWGGALARALAGEDPRRAAELAASVRRRAERFGTDTAIGEALRVEASLATGRKATSLYAQAVTYLAASPSAYEHAAARVEYGIANRSVSELNRGLTLAESCGADGLARRAREELGRLE